MKPFKVQVTITTTVVVNASDIQDAVDKIQASYADDPAVVLNDFKITL